MQALVSRFPETSNTVYFVILCFQTGLWQCLSKHPWGFCHLEQRRCRGWGGFIDWTDSSRNTLARAPCSNTCGKNQAHSYNLYDITHIYCIYNDVLVSYNILVMRNIKPGSNMCVQNNRVELMQGLWNFEHVWTFNSFCC